MSPFLALPGEIHSQIASYLALEDLLHYLSTHPTLLSLTQTHLSPLPNLIKRILADGQPYPIAFGRLPSLGSFLPDDDGRLFIGVLVQARPRWILERLELGKWTGAIWQEAFERRFLPSWKRYKVDDDTWRAVFLRLLGRLEHRNIGCTHEESWTRFITLHRNGSASINRIYSRQFDPYQIYDELKHQNNFASEPTTVRIVLHLQDVRIVALGVLYRYPSLFVNQNAHDLLHPPLLHGLQTAVATSDRVQERRVSVTSPSASEGISFAPLPSTNVHPVSAGHTSAAITNEAYFPLVRTLSPGAGGAQGPSYGMPDVGGSSSSSPPPTTRRSTFSVFRPSPKQAKRPSYPNITVPLAVEPQSSGSMARLGAMLTLTRSRDSDDSKRRWSVGRRRSSGSGSEKGGPIIPASALFGASHPATGGLASAAGSSVAVNLADGATGGRVIPAAALFTDYASTSAPGRSILANPSAAAAPAALSEPVHTAAEVEAEAAVLPIVDIPRDPPEEIIVAAPLPPPPVTPRYHLPYPPLRKPQPARSHRFYPNFTPPDPPPVPPTPPDGTDGTTATSPPDQADGVDVPSHLYDRRRLYESIEDDYAGHLWARRRTSRYGYGEDGGTGTGTGAGAADDNELGWDASAQGERLVEWDEGEGVRKRWVGPLILVAQIHPTHHPRAQPPGVDPLLPTEGPDPDLGPKGMYASLGFEDLEAIMGWVELKGGGAYVAEPRRGGMGF